jgi:repressor LexA
MGVYTVHPYGMSLTERQREIIEFVREFSEHRGSSPTCSEIQSHFGFASPATVSNHLELLEKKGAIQREPGKARNIILPGPKACVLHIPIFGTIPAGYPSAQGQECEHWVSIDAELIRLPKNARVFALQVRGESMKDAAIVDGDIVIMEHCEPRSGDVVAALIDGETTLKRYVIQRGKPFLQAENRKYPDLIPAQELVVQGVFRALIRTHTV